MRGNCNIRAWRYILRGRRAVVLRDIVSPNTAISKVPPGGSTQNHDGNTRLLSAIDMFPCHIDCISDSTNPMMDDERIRAAVRVVGPDQAD